MTTLLLILLGINLVALGAVWVLYRRVRKAQHKRRVEAPNSEYRSRYVMDLDSKERGERLDLSRLHEVNREEAERILAKLRVANVRVLSSQERAFLDRLVEAEKRVGRAARREQVSQGGPHTPRPAAGTS